MTNNMQKEAAFKVITLTLVFLLVFGNSLFQVGHVFAEADVAKPVLNSIMVEPKDASVGDTVKISVDAVDAETGIKSVYISYKTPITQKTKGYLLTYNPDTEKYETQISITDGTENGTWQLDYVSIEDQGENKLNLYDIDSGVSLNKTDLSSGDFNVTGTTGADVTNPVLKSIVTEPKESTVGDTVKISIKAEDTESGIKSVYISYKTPITQKTKGYLLTYNPETGNYEKTIDISDELERGTWQLDYVSIEDQGENKLNLYDIDSGVSLNKTDLSSGDFSIQDGEFIQPLDQRVVTKNERWTSEIINGDLYIGPKAVLTINGNVTVNGNIYVLGALVSYGTFNVNGTIYANSYTWGVSTTLYNGTVNIRGGINNIRSQVATNRPVKDIPFEIYTNPIIAENGVIKYLEGATLPIADMYVEDKKVDLRWNGTFYLNDLFVENKENLDITFIDVFGTRIRKQIPLKIVDTIAPTAAANIPAGYYGSSKSIELSMSEAGTIYYTLDGKTPTTSSKVYSGPIEINKTTTLKFLAVDKYGNQSEVYTEKYLFFTVSDVTDQSTSITGSAQPNATVLVKADNSEWSGTADQSGEFTVDIPKLLAGTSLTIQSTTKDGLESEAIDLTVKDVTAPVKPEVNEVTDQSKQVTGKAEEGAIIKVKAGNTEIGTGTAGSDGKFTINIPLQQAGSKLSVTATDQAGNTSEETSVQVKDVTAPAKPEVNEVTDQSKQVTGKAEEGAIIKVKAEDVEIGTGKAGANGEFTIDILFQRAGSTLVVTATDQAGNTSEGITVQVKDVTAPSAPDVKDVTDKSTQVIGKAEVGAIIKVKAGDTEIGTGTAGTDGKFTINIPLQKAGSILTVTATDQAGNTSKKTTVQIKDVTAPAKPVVNVVNNKSKQVTGKAEVGAKITVVTAGKTIGTGTVKEDGTFTVDIPQQSTDTTLIVTATDKAGNVSEETKVIVQLLNPSVKYKTHVQDYGWQEFVKDGELAGTEGEGKRLEAIQIKLENMPYTGGITYTTHVQDYGWLKEVSDGVMSGTSGESRRLEAIKINLTGEMAEQYDIYYRVHVQDYGWLDWAKNGEPAGTAGRAKRLESIEIVLVKKGGQAPGSTAKPYLEPIPSVVYTTHVQDYGWLANVKDGAMSGTSGKAKRLEGIKISLQNSPYSGSIEYTTHVQDYGWLKNVTNGAMSGTTGKSKRLEAIEINLSGEIAKHYDIYYRVHIQDYGWLGWAKNGMRAGSEGLARRLEGIEIKLVEKGKGETVNPNASFIRK
ncbi:Ig-like domain-containing protein [Caldifermentibacillus hisashii]|uniref:Ig-like domain-containing protein n=1 Tax=Caldifermentibacillus hisashii TaxID=996558 RepID=UPI002E1BABD7|nr:Ig-like domain-containing protein [Caldifermentibacillus hisashii]